MNIGKQLSIMVNDQNEINDGNKQTLKIDLQSAGFIPKTKTLSSESPTARIPIPKDTESFVEHNLARLKLNVHESSRFKGGQRGALSPNRDGKAESSPRNSPFKFSTFAMPDAEGFLDRIGT